MGRAGELVHRVPPERAGQAHAADRHRDQRGRERQQVPPTQALSDRDGMRDDRRPPLIVDLLRFAGIVGPEG
jgi:hypothetical protein